MKQHRVNLTAEERERLQAIAHTGSAKAQESTRARILLASDEHSPALKDEEIARALGVTRQTVEIVRKKYVSHGLLATVYRASHKNKGVPIKIDGRVEAHIVALACSPAPDDKPRWTLSLLADRLVQLEVVDGLSHESVRSVLKKTRLSLT